MSFTNTSCEFWRGFEDEEESSFLSFGIVNHPGSLVAAGSFCASGNLASRAALRLSLEHFSSGIFRSMEDVSLSEPPERILEAGFQRSNEEIYQFGHRLAAGGRISLGMIGVVLEDNTIAVGRVGSGAAYLFRDGEMFPFFEEASSSNRSIAHENFIGQRSLIEVELSSLQIYSKDRILLLSESSSEEKTEQLIDWYSETEENPDRSALKSLSQWFEPESLSFAFMGEMGPDTIFLSEVYSPPIKMPGERC